MAGLGTPPSYSPPAQVAAIFLLTERTVLAQSRNEDPMNLLASIMRA
jgi:hypothetical protein